MYKLPVTEEMKKEIIETYKKTQSVDLTANQTLIDGVSICNRTLRLWLKKWGVKLYKQGRRKGHPSWNK